MLLITGADQYVGYSVAAHLTKHESMRSNMRLLCQDVTFCHGFQHVGIDVRTVDYEHPNDLSLAMRGVTHLVLAIGYECNRVNYCKNILEVAVKSGVKSIICLSHVGASSAKHEALRDYMKIEVAVMKTPCQKIIFRLDFLQQGFHLMASYVEVKRHLMLPMGADSRMTPIDMVDVCDVIACVLLIEDRLVSEFDKKHDGQLYVLSGPESLLGEDIVKHLRDATQYKKFHYKQGRLMDLEYHLNELKKNIWVDSRLKQEKSQLYRETFADESYSSRVHSLPTRKHIQTYIDYFGWIAQTANSVSVPHASMITNRPCQTVQSFFEKNANSFKPKV